MTIEIIFHTASAAKQHTNVDTIYTKDALLCVQLSDGLIMKYPLMNVFSIAHKHYYHLGTTRKDD